MSDNEYPTDAQLKKVQDWEIASTTDRSIAQLIEYIESIWWAPDWGFKLYRGRDSLFGKRRVMKLQLHTGGWSGNEDIIRALETTFLFWSLFWEKSIRGGHYWFEFPTSIWSKRRRQEVAG